MKRREHAARSNRSVIFNADRKSHEKAENKKKRENSDNEILMMCDRERVSSLAPFSPPFLHNWFNQESERQIHK